MLCQLSYRGSCSGKVSKDSTLPLNRSGPGTHLVRGRTQALLGGTSDDRIVRVEASVVLAGPHDLAVTVR